MPDITVVDTSVLIALEKINLLELLCKIYVEIILPEAVAREFGTPTIDCYRVKKVESPLVKLLATDLNLGKGESETIALASQAGARIIVDDLKARGIAETLNLKVTGTIGVLLKAQELGFVQNAREKVKELREKGFYVSEELLVKLNKLK
jgi:hypothetical protein